MKKILNNLNKIISYEYPNSNFKIEYNYGIINIDKNLVCHGMIIISFTANNIQYTYKLIRASIETKILSRKKMIKEVKKLLMNSLLINLLYARGELSIPGLLSGKVKPLEYLITA